MAYFTAINEMHPLIVFLNSQYVTKDVFLNETIFSHISISQLEKIGHVSTDDRAATTSADSLQCFHLIVFLLMIVFVNRRLLYSNKN